MAGFSPKKIIAMEIIAIMFLIILIFTKKEAMHVTDLNRTDFELSYSSEEISFYEPKPNTYANNFTPPWLEETVEYKINADTLRDSKDHDIFKDQGVFRIVTLGDSFTYGLFVAEDKTYPKILEALLNDKCQAPPVYEVLNLGVPGYDVRYAGERLALRGAKYDPDLVVWLIQHDDFIRVAEYTSNNLRGTPELEEELLKQHDKLSDREKAIYQARGFARAREAFSGPLVLYMPHLSFLKEAPMPKPRIQRIGRELLSPIPFEVSLGKQMVGYIPLLFSPNKEYAKVVKAFVEDNNDIYAYESDLRLETHVDFYPDMHPRASGNKKYAEDLFSYLVANELVPCDTTNDPIAR